MMRPRKSGQTTTSESMLRHKVRNLRAKVRLLLPMNLCFKQQKRTKNLMKMSHNYQVQQQMRIKKWNHTRQDPMKFYVPKRNVILQKHLFQKLTNAEIDQIKEDKLYYVGEEFLPQFDKFLQSRERETIGRLTHITSSAKLKPIVESFSQLDHNQHQRQSIKFNSLGKQNASHLAVKNDINYQNFKNKRKLITDEQNTRRAIIKLKRKQKEETYRANLQRSNALKQESIKQKNKLDMLRTSQSIRIREVFGQMGEINMMSQKLRLICLNRSSKSANMFNRV